MPELEESTEETHELNLENFDVNKRLFLKALVKTLGIASHAAKMVRMHVSTHYLWAKEDAEYAKAVEVIKEMTVDWVESKLFERINGVECVKYNDKGEAKLYEIPPDNTCIIFYLKTRAKHRGFIERQELTGADGKDLGPTIIVHSEADKKQIEET